MHGWLGYFLALAALLVLAPLFALLGRKHGRSIKGGAGEREGGDEGEERWFQPRRTFLVRTIFRL